MATGRSMLRVYMLSIYSSQEEFRVNFVCICFIWHGFIIEIKSFFWNQEVANVRFECESASFQSGSLCTPLSCFLSFLWAHSLFRHPKKKKKMVSSLFQIFHLSNGIVNIESGSLCLFHVVGKNPWRHSACLDLTNVLLDYCSSKGHEV